MTCRVALTVATSLLLATPAHAHWLDQYLQATTIDLSRNRVHLQLKLTPGVAVFPRILAAIDANADGVVSATEQRAYATRVLSDVSLTIDGRALSLQLTGVTFASIAQLRDGLGVIQIDVAAPVGPGAAVRQLTFENRHQRAIAVYLVNSLVPRDSALRITSQQRNYEQSAYRMAYTDGVVVPDARLPASGRWPAVLSVIPVAWIASRYRRRQHRAPTDG
jgi:hypothetical protein